MSGQMGEDIIRLKELVRIVRRNSAVAAAAVVVCTSLAITAAFIVPPRYKSTATLNIPAAYFQIPLVGDLIASVHEASELRAQRESLLRLALSDDFVDSLAEKNGAYSPGKADRLRAIEREHFRKSLLYFAVGATTYQISANGKSPEQAREITSAVLEKMISTLISERLSKLTRTRIAIESNLQSLRVALAAGGEQPNSLTVNMLRDELARARADLTMLENRFTPQHPTVLEQRRKVESLGERLSHLSEGGKRRPEGDDSAMATGSKRALQEMYDELVRKFNYLNVVLDMEKDTTNIPYLSVIEQPTSPPTPFFPKKRVFAFAGLALGLVIGLILAIYRELKKGTFMSPARAAEALNVPFLGVMPSWRITGDQRLLIEGYTEREGPKRLTAHDNREDEHGS
jgi:hypothetical protein